MPKLSVFNVEAIGNGQYRCGFKVVDEQSGATLAAEDGCVVMAGARYEIVPEIFALIEAGQFEGTIKPFVPE